MSESTFLFRLSQMIAHTLWWETKNEYSPNGIVDDAVNGLDEALIGLSLAATAAGTGMSIAGADAQADQMNQRTADTIARESQLAQKNKPLADQNLQASTAPKAQKAIDKSAADSMLKYQQVNNLPLTASSPAPNTPATIVDTARNAQTKSIQDAAAKMAGYGGWTTNQSIADQDVRNQLGVNNFNAQQIGAMLPVGLQTADAGNGLDAMGKLLGTAGQLAGAAGIYSKYANIPKAPVLGDFNLNPGVANLA